MKKVVLSALVIGSFGLYVIFQNSGNPSNNFMAPTSASANNSSKKSSKIVAVVPSTSVAVKNPKPAAAKPVSKSAPVVLPPKKTGIYSDGAYVGGSADAYYGNIQVKAVIANGKLADVIFLDYPQDRGTSVRINSYAMPILKSEAIQAQNSNVDTVSGATDSSGAFRESLASALASAKA